MKKIYSYLALASLSLFTLSSCSDDDNKEKPQEQTKDVLLGKWDLKTLSMKLYVDGDLVQEVNDQSVEGEMTMQFDFKADNKVEYYMYVPASEGSEEQKVELTGTYQKKGKDLVITIEGDEQTFKIEGNDAKSLKLSQSVEEEYQGMLIKQDVIYNFGKM